MHILVTNDDGVRAPGLQALAEAVRPFGRVSILAPDRNWSGSGHVKTLTRPLRVFETELADGTPALASDGAPSDCVALAVLGLIEEPIDLVVSGINTTSNMGYDVTYSGTVTAVMEGIVSEIPGVAFSQEGAEFGSQDYTVSQKVATIVLKEVIKRGLPKGVFLNVNVPNCSVDQLRGVQLTRQGLRVYNGRLDERIDPRGQKYYWIAGDRPGGVPEPGTDIGALAAGFASVTPLQLDLTAHGRLVDWEWYIAIDGQTPETGVAPAS